MVLGTTGTRKGLTDLQLQELQIYIGYGESMPKQLHHGAAIGADEQVAKLFRYYGGCWIVAHPCTWENQVSKESLKCSDFVFTPSLALDRNRSIVMNADSMIAFPAGMAEEQRSGTWHTIRNARRKGKPLLIIWPDGTSSGASSLPHFSDT